MAPRPVLLQLDDELVADLDAMAADQRENRSSLARKLLRDCIERERQKSIDQRIVEGYDRIPDREDERLIEATKRMIMEEPW